MKIIIEKNYNLCIYIFAFLVLITSESIYESVFGVLDYGLKIFLIAFFVPVLLLINRQYVKLYTLIGFAMIMCSILCILGGSVTTMEFLKIWVRFFPILFIVTFYETRGYDTFYIIYKVILFLIILSLLFYVCFDLGVLQIQPNIIRVPMENGEYKFYREYLKIYYRWHNTRKVLGYNLVSANGIWHEPGAYQIYINLGLYYELNMREKASIKRILIFVVACISSTSTAGLILTILLLFCYFIKKSQPYIVFVFGCFIGLLCMSIILLLLQEKALTMNWLFRVSNILESLKLLSEIHLFGADYNNMKIWCGLLAYFIQFGIFGFIPYYLIFKSIICSTFTDEFWAKVSFFLWWFISLLDENYSLHNIIFYIYAFLIVQNLIKHKGMPITKKTNADIKFGERCV